LKRIIAIFLVVLLLFNALGFYGLLAGLKYKSTIEMVERLDQQQYSHTETITIAVPFAIPYQQDSEYSRVDGEIEHNGEFYRLVKQKFEKDTLFIVCIKDHQSKRIKHALADYVKTFTDKPVNAKHAAKGSITFIKDFLLTSINISHASQGWNCALIQASFLDYFYDRTPVVFTPPPRS
jgi:hypothetical protein